MRIGFDLLLAAVLTLGSQSASVCANQVKSSSDLKSLSLQDAFHMLQKDASILFVDVRDPIEVSRFGRPAQIDVVVPLYARSESRSLVLNPAFLERFEEYAADLRITKNDTVFISCGNAIRAAKAAKILSNAGFTDVWYLSDEDVNSSEPIDFLTEQHSWRDAGMPWSFEQIPGDEFIMILDDQETQD